ncbi:MAG: hypothetical protein WCJ56_14395 [bacterium]
MVAIFLLLLLGVGAQASSFYADEQIRRADALAGDGNYTGAIDLLRGLSLREPGNARVYLELANWQKNRLLQNIDVPTKNMQEREVMLRERIYDIRYHDGVRDLLDTYARGVMNLPEANALRQRAQLLISQELPVTMSEFSPLVLPGNPAVFTYNINDPHLVPAQMGMRRSLITTTPLPTSNRLLKDPKYGGSGKPEYARWTFPNIIYAYEFDGTDRTWKLRFRILWQDVPERTDIRANQARQVAQFMLRLSGLVKAESGLGPRFSEDGVVNIWLAEDGTMGAEEYGENVYVFQVAAARTELEWVRELMHEYGHQTLPTVGGYTVPEWAASGRLGERLFLRWLFANPDTDLDNRGWTLGLDPVRLQERRINVLERKFAAVGPEDKMLLGTDADAMDAFVGMALYLDITRGGEWLAKALGEVKSPAYTGKLGFLNTVVALEKASQQQGQPTVTLRLRDLPENLPLWVYLEAGNWGATIDRADRLNLTITATIDGKECPVTPAGAFRTGDITAGWHVITLKADGGIPSYRTLRLLRP